MNSLGVGCPPGQGTGNEMLLLLVLLIASPGLFGGENSMLFLLIFIMLFSGGRLF